MRIKFQFIIMVLFIATVLTGCSALDIPDVPIAYPKNNKIDLTVKINLTDELRNTQWGTDGRGYMRGAIGVTFSKNSEELLDEIFSEVIVSNKLSESEKVEVDATFTPKVVSIKQTYPLTVFGDMEATIIYEWTVIDKIGNIIWVDTIVVRHKGPWDSWTPKKHALNQFNTLVTELFKKSFESITSSQEIRALVGKK